MRTHDDVIEQVIALFAAQADQSYIGENVSQLEHALQAAQLARQAGASNEVIAAALMHDIGHFDSDAEKMGEFGVARHEHLGADLVRELGFTEGVAELIVGHVAAKRYLVGKHDHYLKQLSPASLETLKHQGGPMGPEEMARFEQSRHFKDTLRLRAWDDQAKIEHLSVPDIQTYREVLRSVLK